MTAPAPESRVRGKRGPKPLGEKTRMIRIPGELTNTVQEMTRAFRAAQKAAAMKTK